MTKAEGGATALQPVPRVSVFQAVVDQLSSWLASGAVAPGERLPSERELSEQLQVSRASLREALRALRATGLIESRGRAAYLRKQSDHPEQGISTLAISFAEAERLELHEFRGAIETEIAALAAERHDALDLRALQQTLTAMDQAIQNDPAAFWEADHRFHRALAHAARNRLLLAAQEQVYQLLPIGAGSSTEIRSPALTQRFALTAKDHRRILEAILERDAAKARQAMRDHIARTRQHVLVDAFTQVSAD